MKRKPKISKKFKEMLRKLDFGTFIGEMWHRLIKEKEKIAGLLICLDHSYFLLIMETIL